MSIEKTDEKRRFRRIFYNADATLTGDGEELPCKLVDISLKGCLLSFDAPWSGDLERLYVLTLHLSDEVAIVMNVRISHVVDKRVGCRCEHIDIDSISELRRLVELNLGDSELLERELAALSDIASADSK